MAGETHPLLQRLLMPTLRFRLLRWCRIIKALIPVPVTAFLLVVVPFFPLADFLGRCAAAGLTVASREVLFKIRLYALLLLLFLVNLGALEFEGATTRAAVHGILVRGHGWCELGPVR